MRKADAIKLFKTGAALARGVGLTRGRISQWPDELTQKQADLVRGAAVRLGLIRAGETGDAVEPEIRARAGCERRDHERRADDPSFGEFGEARTADRRQEDRRRDGCEGEASA